MVARAVWDKCGSDVDGATYSIAGEECGSKEFCNVDAQTSCTAIFGQGRLKLDGDLLREIPE